MLYHATVIFSDFFRFFSCDAFNFGWPTTKMTLILAPIVMMGGENAYAWKERGEKGNKGKRGYSMEKDARKDITLRMYAMSSLCSVFN